MVAFIMCCIFTWHIFQEEAVDKKSENMKAQTWNSREVAKITLLHESTGHWNYMIEKLCCYINKSGYYPIRKIIFVNFMAMYIVAH